MTSPPKNDSALKKILIGILVTVIGGLLLAYFTKKLESEDVDSPIEPKQESLIQINYASPDPTLILGPNPGGIWASSTDQVFLWHHIDISITNRCNAPIHIDPEEFRLSFSVNKEFDISKSSAPTTEGTEFQSNRLKPAFLDPNESLKGRLIFKVKDKLYDASDGKYDILRYQGPLQCKIKYSQ